MVTDQQLNEIIDIIILDCQPEKIILFGSYARGTAKEDSDLDLAIVHNTDLPMHKRAAEFRRALRSNGRKWFFGMDILVYTPEEFMKEKQIRNSFAYEINNTGKLLYEYA